MQEQSIFIEALEMEDPAERAAFLDRVCAGDPALRARLDKLLARHHQGGSFLDCPASGLDTTVETPLAECPGSVIGQYRLLEQIGAGGMGLVFVAEQQQPVRRRVALKVIKPGMDTREVIARFEAERQALALMDHPNIARVLDGGATPSGRPYFVMELVRGVPITKFCDDNRLTARERLDLFVHVCQAAQHAHQKGIIHRDIKPSNVLVTLHDGTPVVKVIDFGVAKAVGQQLTDKTVYTGFMQMIGTPLYMSPEQAEMSALDVDTRSDVYSLGVLLYELLTGTTPFDRDRLKTVGLDEIRRIIREEEPPRPSTRISTLGAAATTASTHRKTDPKRLAQSFRGELDWIVMKALEKDRNRRYESASALAGDVQRFLQDEPVVAHPPTAGYRLRKFVRRHKGPVLAASVFLLLLAAGIVGTTTGLVRALAAEQETREALTQVTGEQAKTQAALTQVTAEQAKTQAALSAAREALDALTDDVVETMFAKQPELEEPEKAFLRKVLKLYEGFMQQLGDTPEARLFAAKGYFKVAHLGSLLGDRFKAEADYHQAANRLERLVADFPEVPDYRQKLAATYNNLGVVLAELRKQEDAETAFRRAIRLRQQLAEDFPEVRQHRRDLAGSFNDLGFLLKERKQYAAAEEACDQAVALMQPLAAATDASPLYRQMLARCRSNLAQLLREQRRYPEAEQVYRAIVPVQQKCLEEFPTVPKLRRELADSYHGLGIVLAELRKGEEAESTFQESLALRQKLADDFPNVLQYRRELASGYNDLGQVKGRLHKFVEAEAAFRQALNLREKMAARIGAVPQFLQELASSYDSLSNVLVATGRPEEAEAAVRSALAIRKQLAADFPNVPDYANSLGGTLGNLAVLLNHRREFAAARPLLDEARPHLRTALAASPSHPLYRIYYRNFLQALAETCHGLGDHAQLASAADELAAAGVQPANDTYLAARRLCDCALLAGKDPQLPDDRRRELARTYTDRSMALLQQAVARGFKDAAQLKQTPDLEPLRSRDDFKKLLTELEQKPERNDK